MLKSTEHQFWLTKKTVERKFGSKEDKHIISSDAELDAKIEVFKSVTETSAELNKIIDQYQERLCILSQEECVFGRFLKEVGKRSKTTGQSITNTGKAISYSGQQRLCVRIPLIRLKHEVCVFRQQAVLDTKATIQIMEKERTEYRAALSWMKSASGELDPDTGRGLEKFRTAQSHVREAKKGFDCISMDSIQKIDLLAAARCNMYSQALVSYMTELKAFAQKTSNTFKTISSSLTLKPRYDFCVLRELTQHEGGGENQRDADGRASDDKLTSLPEKDQPLFFADDYHDKDGSPLNSPSVEASAAIATDTTSDENVLLVLSQISDGSAADLEQDNQTILSDFWSNTAPVDGEQQMHGLVPTAAQPNSNGGNSAATVARDNQNAKQQKKMRNSATTAAASNWINLFAEIDPLANPDAFNFKLHNGRENFQQT